MGIALSDYHAMQMRLDKARKPSGAAGGASSAPKPVDCLKLVAPGFSIYERNNFQTDAAISNTEQRERPQALAASGERKTPRPGLRHCRFTLRRLKLIDVDAKYASVKDLLDCLTIAGVIRGDKEGEITLEVNQEKVKKGETEETIIEVFFEAIEL